MSDQTPPPGDSGSIDPTTPPPPPPPPAAPVPPAPPAGPVGGQPSPAEGPWSVGNAFSYGWAKFQEHLSAILIAMLVLFIGGAVLIGLWVVIVGAISNALWKPGVTIDPNTGVLDISSGPGFIGTLILGALGALVYLAIIGVIQAAVTRAALAITDGKKIETSTLLSTERIVPIIIAAVIVSALTAVGYLFCFIGAPIISFFLSYTFYFLLDKNMEPIEAVKASFNLVKDNIGELILFFLGSLVAYFIGAILCGIGLIVAIPVIVIATAYTYKKFTNQAVAA
jgi:hypothetical protein